ncbi:hypothetical protein DASB73_036580 [Starmerella bacillaris]|uniref:Guanine nucleotide-binding protein subunit gamma n=1 Tax=Starmerella bacillaris TaxID=1247836 RepID=A0AAV5RMP5_STABA|nr:hypothetical protein DASB73_036580 [Starmerella bacillaris]
MEENLSTLSYQDRQSNALYNIKVRRLLAMRERIMNEIRCRENSPEESCREIIDYMQRTSDPFAPNPERIKVYEKYN